MSHVEINVVMIFLSYFRGDFVEGTVDNRRVTIVGTPNCAQTAHTLIVHKLRQALDEGYL